MKIPSQKTEVLRFKAFTKKSFPQFGEYNHHSPLYASQKKVKRACLYQAVNPIICGCHYILRNLNTQRGIAAKLGFHHIACAHLPYSFGRTCKDAIPAAKSKHGRNVGH
jgi:hypothetical protein